MAQKEKNILKKYFRKGEYPTESQFSDLIDSLRHFSDEILLSDVTGLNKALNTKFNVSEGEALKKELSAQKNDIDDVSNVCENLSDNLKLLETFVGDSRDLEPDGGTLTLNIHNLWQSLTNLKRDEIEPLKTEVNIVAGIASKAREMASTNAANISAINQRIEKCLTLEDLLPVTEKQIDKALEPIDERIEKLESKTTAVTQKRKPSGILHLTHITPNSPVGEAYYCSNLRINLPVSEEKKVITGSLDMSVLFPNGIPGGFLMELRGCKAYYDKDDNKIYWFDENDRNINWFDKTDRKFESCKDLERKTRNSTEYGAPAIKLFPRGILYGLRTEENDSKAIWIINKDSSLLIISPILRYNASVEGNIEYKDFSELYSEIRHTYKPLKSEPVSKEKFKQWIDLSNDRTYSRSHSIQIQKRIIYEYPVKGNFQTGVKWRTKLSATRATDRRPYSGTINQAGVYRVRRKSKRKDWSEWRYFLVAKRQRFDDTGDYVKEL